LNIGKYKHVLYKIECRSKKALEKVKTLPN